jgi:hypothetical protein
MSFKKIAQFILYDPVRKIAAIIFAFGIWFFVAIDNDYQYAKDLEINYINLAESLIIVDSPAIINVIFSGRGGALLSNWAAPPKALCDLDKATTGDNIITSKKIVIPVAFGDIAVRYNVQSIKLTVDQKISKKMNVNVPIKGSLKEGYSINDIIVLDTVNLTGPKDMLRTMSEILAETLDVKNKSTSYITESKIVQVSPLFEISKEYVRVEVKVDTTDEKLFTNLPLKLIFTPDQRVSSEKISLDTLIVRGSRMRTANLRKRNIDVEIKLTKLAPGDYNLPATIILPKYITPVYSNPKRFKIKIH